MRGVGGRVRFAVMSLRVLHAVESTECEAGSVAIALGDLTDTLDGVGVVCETIARTNEADVPDRVRGADLVHIHGAGGAFACGVADAARRAGRPYVVSPLGAFCGDGFEKTGWWKRLKASSHRRRLLKGAAAVCVLDAFEAAVVRASGHVGEAHELPYGLSFDRYAQDVEALSPDVLDIGDDRCMLFLGPIHPVEGLIPLLRAVAELGHDFRGWRLVLAGPQPGIWRGKIEASLARKHALDRVAFVCNPNIEMQRALLARASLLVSPSLTMRCPTSVVQAIASGIPVVASAHGLGVVVTEAVRVCVSDGCALRDALRPLVTQDHNALRAEGDRMRAMLKPHLDLSAVVGQYVDIYEASVRSSRSGVGG